MGTDKDLAWRDEIAFKRASARAQLDASGAADVNDSGAVDIADPVFGLQFLVRGEAEPRRPAPSIVDRIRRRTI